MGENKRKEKRDASAALGAAAFATANFVDLSLKGNVVGEVIVEPALQSHYRR